MNLRFLGTADSSGIPTHNCKCIICEEYRNKGIKNLATNAYLESTNNEIILLDAGTESISEIFDNKTIKAIFLTHFHADHVLGLLRLRYSSDEITCYHPKDSDGFADLFKHKKAIKYIENTPFEKIVINNIEFYPVPLKHSKNTTGYIIKNEEKTIAYLTDCGGISEKSMQFLKSFDLDECYIDAGANPNIENKNHLDYIQGTKVLDKIGAKNSFLIHCNHKVLSTIKKEKIKLKYDYINKTQNLGTSIS